MKIVDRATFLQLPAGTAYMRKPVGVVQLQAPIEVKASAPDHYSNDWAYTQLVDADWGSTNEFLDVVDRMSGEHVPVAPDEGMMRDGRFEAPTDVEFIVFDSDDLRTMGEYLIHHANLSWLHEQGPSDG